MAVLTDGPQAVAARQARLASPAPDCPPAPEGTGRGAAIFKRLLHGTGAGAVAYGIGVASNLLLLPLYLQSWSVVVYGEWMALYSLVNYLANLDFGITAAGVNAATMAHARGDWQEFKRVQGTAWAASVAIMVLGVALVVMPFLFYFHVERWLNLRAMTPGEARLVFCCLAVSLLANIPGRQLISVYISIGEFAKYQWLYNSFLLASCLVIAGFLSAGAGPVPLAVVTVTTALSTIVISAWLLHRRDPKLVPRIRAADWATARTLAPPTAQFGVSILATVLTLQAPVVLLSRVLGGPAVALFTTTRTVANVIRQSVGLMRYPLRPELAALSAKHSKITLGRLFRFAISIDATVGVSLFAALWSGGCGLIRLWSRGRIEPESAFVHLILISVLLEGFFVSLGSTGWATNRVKALSLAQFAAAVASLLLAVALVGPFGVSAVPLAAIAPLLLIMAPISIRDACRNAGLTLQFLVGRLLLPFAAITAFSVAVSQWFTGLKMSPVWLSASLSALVTCGLALFIAGCVFLTREDRQLLRNRILLNFHNRPIG